MGKDVASLQPAVRFPFRGMRVSQAERSWISSQYKCEGLASDSRQGGCTKLGLTADSVEFQSLHRASVVSICGVLLVGHVLATMASLRVLTLACHACWSDNLRQHTPHIKIGTIIG